MEHKPLGSSESRLPNRWTASPRTRESQELVTRRVTSLAGEARTVTRRANPDTPEVPPLDAEVLLAAGDAFFHDEDWVGIDHAAGDAPCVLLLAVLFDPTQPLAHLMEGTPTP